MKRYRILLKGNNFLMNTNGKPRKHGFHQNLVIEADSPKKAKLIALATTRLDKELKGILLNKESDPPEIRVDTFWELDVLENVNDLDTERHYYVEKRWWQFWKWFRRTPSYSLL